MPLSDDTLHERLTRATAYLRPALEWSVRFSLDGPPAVPRGLRKVPLHIVCALFKAHALLIVHGP